VTTGAQILGRGLAFPPRVGSDGRLQASEGTQNVREAIRIVLATEPSERLRLPTFGAGLGRFLFEPNTTATQRQIQDRIVNALRDWEPRILIDSVDVVADPVDPESALATITYRLVATQSAERVTVSVSVGA
jgi:phage baseplate assembly protein W